MKKNKNYKKPVWTVISCLLICGFAALPVFADSAYRKEQQGSIAIELKDLGTRREKVELEIYQVGEATGESKPDFNWIKDVNSSMAADDLQYAETQQKAAEELEKFISAHQIKPLQEGLTDSKGNIGFSDLNQGVYLVRQAEESSYGIVEPFLVFLPYQNEQREWIYEIKSYPKAEKTVQKPSPPPISPTPSVPTDGSLVETGDDSSLVIPILLVTGSLVGVLVLVKMRKKSSE